MDKTKDIKKQETNGNGSNAAKIETLPKNYEVDESPAAKAFMKAVRMTRRRLYPELCEKTKKRA